MPQPGKLTFALVKPVRAVAPGWWTGLDPTDRPCARWARVRAHTKPSNCNNHTNRARTAKVKAPRARGDRAEGPEARKAQAARRNFEVACSPTGKAQGRGDPPANALDQEANPTALIEIAPTKGPQQKNEQQDDETGTATPTERASDSSMVEAESGSRRVRPEK